MAALIVSRVTLVTTNRRETRAMTVTARNRQEEIVASISNAKFAVNNSAMRHPIAGTISTNATMK